MINIRPYKYNGTLGSVKFELTSNLYNQNEKYETKVLTNLVFTLINQGVDIYLSGELTSNA